VAEQSGVSSPTKEGRERLSWKIHTWKPWEYSTGPRTPEGKAKVSKNAIKHSGRNHEVREIHDVLERHKNLLRALSKGKLGPNSG
jgi:hypothetical protein